MCWHFAGLILAALVTLPWVTPAGASERCVVTPGFNTFLETLENAVAISGSYSRDQIAVLRRQVSNIDRAAVHERLGEISLPHLRGTVDDVLRGAQRFASGSMAADTDRLRNNVQALGHALSGGCSGSGREVLGLDVRAYEAELKSEVTTNDDPLLYNTEMESAVLIGAVVTLLLLCMGLVVFARHLSAIVRGLMKNRTTCSVPCSLALDGYPYEGRILVLGETGCRFEPNSEDVFDLIALKAGTCEFEIQFKNIRIPCIVARINERNLGIYFEMPISLRVQTEILVGSEHEISRAPIGGRRPNVRQQLPLQKRPFTVIKS